MGTQTWSQVWSNRVLMMNKRFNDQQTPLINMTLTFKLHSKKAVVLVIHELNVCACSRRTFRLDTILPLFVFLVYIRQKDSSLSLLFF
jgi:hypothetical protein